MLISTDRASRAGLLLAALCLLAGCESGPKNAQVSGRMLHSPETFTGTSTASVGGSGTVILKSNHGAYCSGPYTQQPDDNTGEIAPGGGTPPRGRSGMVKLTCRDGRTGSILFLVGQDQAVGTGMLGKDIVTLTIDASSMTSISELFDLQ